MDNNYLYISGFLGIMLVAFIVFYYLKMKNKRATSENMESSKIEEHITEGHGIECDGDKCFFKDSQSNYDKCDENKCM